MHVPGLRRGSPLVARERREAPRLVMVASRLEDHVLPGAARGLGPGVERRVVRLVAAVVADHVLHEPRALLVFRLEIAQFPQHRVVAALRAGHLRRIHLADELRVVRDGDEVERAADVVLLAVDRDVLALREAVGLVRSDARAADVRVQRIRGVDVRFAEVRVLQRILCNRRFELLDRRRGRGGRNRRRGRRLGAGRVRLLSAACDGDQHRQRNQRQPCVALRAHPLLDPTPAHICCPWKVFIA